MKICCLFSAALFLLSTAAPVYSHQSTRHLLQARLEAPIESAPARVVTAQTSQLTIEVVEATTETPLSGLVRILRDDGTALALEGLLDRGLGLEADFQRLGWHVIHGRATVAVPREQITVEVISGIETELERRKLDLHGSKMELLRFELNRFFDSRAQGLQSGNTHLHLMKLSRTQSDRYLREIPRGDGLDLLFVSHLERIADDAYITNTYSSGDLQALSGDGILFGNGEEHRQNFDKFGEGYGHVMLLDLKELVEPVSIGPGIMEEGHDGIPLRRGIGSARKDGATVIVCHSAYGFEDVPNWVSGLIDAHNIFDGSLDDNYEDALYPLLNIGLRVPFSSGTDWFMYDFSRVYVPVEGELTVDKWLRELRDGRSFITNGTLLEFSVNDLGPGATVVLSATGAVLVRARGVGRIDFKAIELVHNGRVVSTSKSLAVGGHFEATLDVAVRIDSPSWLALRIPGGGQNELEGKLFAHTSPVYVEVAGNKGVFMPDIARSLITDMLQSIATISKKGKFESDEDRERIIEIYRQGIKVIETRLAQSP